MSKHLTKAEIKTKIFTYIFMYAKTRDLVKIYNFIFTDKIGTPLKKKDIIKQPKKEEQEKNQNIIERFMNINDNINRANLIKSKQFFGKDKIMSVKLKRSRIVRLFEAMGYQTASKWDDSYLKKMIKRLPELAPDAKLEDEKLINRMKSLVDMVERKDALEFEANGEEKASEEEDDTTSEPVKQTKDETNSEKEPKKKEKPAKAKKEKPAKPVKVTRIAAATQVLEGLEGIITFEQAAKKADEIHVASGGKPNSKEALWGLHQVLKVLKSSNKVTVDKQNICPVK